MPTPSTGQSHAPLPIGGRKWRTSPQVQDRLRTVADLRRRGLSQVEIAEQLGVSPATISRDLSRLDLVERHEHAEFTYTQRFECLLTLRELALVCCELISRYRHDPSRAGDVVAAASVVVDAQTEARLLLEGARDPAADAFGEEDGDDDEVLEGEVLSKGLPDTPGPDYGEGELADLRREVDADIARYVSPKQLAVIQRGLAIAARDAHDAAPADESADE